MTLPLYQCDPARLTLLLTGDEASDEFRRSAEHLEHCESCQRQLTLLAAETDVWDEVSISLSDDGKAADDFSASALKLEPPTHPEMLGRLGRHEVERVIGSGGMGVVVKGYDTELNRPVAIKLLASYLAHSGAARVRFAREARAAAAVVHEHVVAIHNIESDVETPFIVMQYVAGESLQERVDRQGPLHVNEILRIGMQAAAGLAAAHTQGVVHRDVKPSNILLERGIERALLTDFGLARVADDATLTRTGIVAGTPNYMSPEQADGEPVDHRSDLFSLGAVLYFMATGHPPFRAERAMAVLKRICHDPHRPVWEISPEIPDELCDVIDRLLEKKPAKRFATAAQVSEVLSNSLAKLQETGSLRRRRRYRQGWSRPARWLAAGSIVAATAWGLTKFWVPDAEAPHPKVPPSATATPIAPQVEMILVDWQALLDVGLSTREKFDATLKSLETELSQLEVQAQQHRTEFLQFGENRWQQDLLELEQELSRSEYSPGPDSQ